MNEECLFTHIVRIVEDDVVPEVLDEVVPALPLALPEEEPSETGIRTGIAFCPFLIFFPR